jgi:hypothetical protein
MGGRGVHTINKLSTGVCMVTEQLLASCGLPCAPPRPAAPLACIGEYGVVSPASGILADNSVIEVGPGAGGCSRPGSPVCVGLFFVRLQPARRGPRLAMRLTD